MKPYDLTPRKARIHALTMQIRRLQEELARLETADVDPVVAARPRTKPEPKCGTEPGYQRHRRLGTAHCEPCRIAHAAHNRATKAMRKRAA